MTPQIYAGSLFRDVYLAYEPDMSVMLPEVMLPEMEPETKRTEAGPLAEPERLYSQCITMLLEV